MIWLFILCMAISFEGKEYVTLEELRWKNRIVIYIPSIGQNTNFDLDSLEEKMAERKIIFLSIGEVFYSNSDLTFSKDYIKELQEKYADEKDQSNWLLIGLDGGIKVFKKGEPDWDFIFNTIDSMPMRQSEIRKNH